MNSTHHRFHPGCLPLGEADVPLAPIPLPPPAIPTPPATPPPTGSRTSAVKKLSFGKIATKKENTKTAYPVFPDPNGAAAALAATIIRQVEEFDALEGSLKTNKEELKFMVAPEYFRVNQGRHEVPSSVSVKSTEGEVLVTFQNRYKTMPDESPIVPFLGDRTGEYFRQAFELKVSGDKLPADRAQEILDALNELFTRFNCPDALEVKTCIKPTTEFHAARHLLLTPDQNFQLDQVCPIIPMVKTKGRK
jgi:hypothetical protein